MGNSSTYPRLTVFHGVNSREWSSCKQRFLSTMLLAESLSLSPFSSPPSPCSHAVILELGAASNRARFFSLQPGKMGSVATTNWPNLHKTRDTTAILKNRTVISSISNLQKMSNTMKTQISLLPPATNPRLSSFVWLIYHTRFQTLELFLL
jgi:hypothetical protein